MSISHDALARLEAATVVLIERELLRSNPRGPYDDPIRRSDADDQVLQDFLAGLIFISRPSRKGAAT